MAYLQRSDKLLVIIGPSGTGKSSAVHRLQAAGVVSVTPSWTTRPPRPDEQAGAIEHRFVDEAEFQRQVAKSHFLEAVQLFGLPYWYGLPKVVKPAAPVVPLVMLRAQLLPLLAKFYDNFVVYQVEDSLEKVKARLQERAVAGQALGSRLHDFEKEIAAGRQLAQRTFTNSGRLEDLVAQLREAITLDFTE